MSYFGPTTENRKRQRKPDKLQRTFPTEAQGVKLFGWLEGPIDFFDEPGQFVEQLDVWWFMNHYETHCRAHDIPINKQLYL